MDLKRATDIVIVLLIVTLAGILLQNAWVTEDAYITFRTIDNFVNGFGLTWNVIERVQAYTHPLWMLTVTFLYYFTGEFFLTSIFLSFILSLLAAWLLVFKFGVGGRSAVITLLVLILSKSFIDYSISGLENPLTHLLLVLFWLIYFRFERGLGPLLVLSLLASLAMLNRMDTILFFLPALVHRFWIERSFKAAGRIAAGFTPFILWEIFSLYYYGFPFPNTAYAKLNTGIAESDLIVQGFKYFINLSIIDPITLLVILAGIVVPLIRKDRSRLAALSGILIYLLYILWIGGDFMSGRFFAAPFLTAVIILFSIDFSSMGRRWWIVVGVVLVTGLVNQLCPIYTTASYSNEQNFLSSIDRSSGIADERAHYFFSSGLLNYKTDRPMPDHHWAEQGREVRGEGAVMVTKSAVGYFGYNAGPEAHVLDDLALTDAFLARLPIPDPKSWRIGHFRRTLPLGYRQSIRYNENLIVDTSLARYYEKLTFITHGKLNDWNRIKEIVKFNLGEYDHWKEHWQKEYMVGISVEALNRPFLEGSVPRQEAFVTFERPGYIVDFGGLIHASRIEIDLSADDDYILVLMNNNFEIMDQRLFGMPDRSNSIARIAIDIPEQKRAEGFDQLKILPYKGDNRYMIGQVFLTK